MLSWQYYVDKGNFSWRYAVSDTAKVRKYKVVT